MNKLINPRKTVRMASLFFSCLMVSACSKGNNSPNAGEDPHPQEEIRPQLPFSQLPARTKSINVPGNRRYVNVMEKQRPKLPKFAPLDVKPGILRGYVKDVFGRPVPDAEIGVRSSIAGGLYSSATAKSDSKGYYEIKIPVGHTEIWGAKINMLHEGGRAFVSLFPADSTLNEFASSSGAVKNFALLPYGEGRPDQIAESPQWPSSYMGGSVHLSYSLRTETLPLPGSFPIGTVIVVKLTPIDLVHADEKVTFVIKKQVLNSELYINNIPLGRYSIEIETGDGAPIFMKEGINLKDEFGLTPKQALRKAEFTFIPGDPECLVWFGNWKEVPLNIEMN
ncbi:Ig-like domain-containing protein [Sphingobacterium puteale]|uniref:Ig-like domain-containing protein n=1 Tax=Sphingobacterium puteale TaxID=2420510 RepID=UPI003D953B55